MNMFARDRKTYVFFETIKKCPENHTYDFVRKVQWRMFLLKMHHSVENPYKKYDILCYIKNNQTAEASYVNTGDLWGTASDMT